jgi:hypothetical protein
MRDFFFYLFFFFFFFFFFPGFPVVSRVGLLHCVSIGLGDGFPMTRRVKPGSKKWNTRVLKLGDAVVFTHE